MFSGKRSTVFSTNASRSLRDNILAIYGVKFMQTLMPIRIELKPWVILARPEDAATDAFIGGFVSKPTIGDGRSSADRQLVFINGRPCNLPKVTC
jgi:DNA mismatch repair protein PMS2